jgi:hypothetical protein
MQIMAHAYFVRAVSHTRKVFLKLTPPGWGYCKLLSCAKFIVKLRHKFHIDSCLETGANSFCHLTLLQMQFCQVPFR